MNELPLSGLFMVLVLLLIASAFFSSSETSLVALNRYRLRHHAQSGRRGARLAQRLLASPDRMFGLILLGNNLVNLTAAAVATLIALRLLGESGVWVSTLVLTAMVLIFAELIPKTLAAMYPQAIAYPASLLLWPLLKLLYPVVWLVNLVANGLLRPFGVQPTRSTHEALSREELRLAVKEGSRSIPLNHQQMLINILDLEHGRVDDIMIPRQDIVGIDLDGRWEDILELLTSALYTRLPVWRGDLDQIVGMLHVRAVIGLLANRQLDRAALEDAVHEAYFIPEGTALTQQLLEFQRREQRTAFVVDEYGDIQGLVTLDDILEEIVGEFSAEGEQQRMLKRREDGSWLIDGAASVRMINRSLDWTLPASGARTLSGLVIEELESLPDGRSCLKIGDYLLTVVDLSDTRIRRVLVKPLRPAPPADLA